MLAAYVANYMHDPDAFIDSQTYGTLLACWGGVVHFLGREHRGRTIRKLCLVLVADIATAGFVAQLTYHLAGYAGVPTGVAVALCGISGHMGSRALALLERQYTKWVGDDRSDG